MACPPQEPLAARFDRLGLAEHGGA
jgi:hypothetical protein